MTRKFDVWFAGSYALWVAAFIGSTYLSATGTWDRMAAIVIR
ncbi:MAG TPA: hypothetical protein VMV57_15025 [Terracidiphilus sp.]|nr:hypothetical protein [Terracidiphilus sp.]